MKKVKLLLVFLIMFTIRPVNANFDLTPNSKSSILIDSLTKEILFEKNSHEKLAPASMTKIMTMILVYEDIISGGMSFDEVITISENAASLGGSQIYLEAGEEMSVRDLYKAMAIGSANDASVALAERVGGTEDNFVKMMNDKAKEMGLINTNFMNPHGLDEENHYSTAYDMAMMGIYLSQYPEVLEYTKTYEDYLRQDSDESFWLVNTNKLVRFMDEVDGIKTGFTPDAMYCLTASAIKDDFRVIAVVMGAPSSSKRNYEIRKLINYAYQQFTYQPILSKDDVLGTIKVYKGVKDESIFGLANDLKVIKSKGSEDRNLNYKIRLNDVIAPIEKGEVIGKLDLYENNEIISTHDIVIHESVDKANILDLFLKYFDIMLNGS